MASAFNDNSDHKNAIVHYKEALKLDPENVETALNIADIYESIGDNNLCYEYFQTAKIIAPQNLRADEGFKRIKQTLDKVAEE